MADRSRIGTDLTVAAIVKTDRRLLRQVSCGADVFIASRAAPRPGAPLFLVGPTWDPERELGPPRTRRLVPVHRRLKRW